MDNPYMTTPELRQGPPPPYTSTSLQVNLFFRVFLGILANIVCWVPMRLLWKNGEFAAAVWCICTMILNVYYVVNSLLWRDDNVESWYAGYGWCDLQMYTTFALETLYAACIFEILRNLASKVAMTRATSLTSSERRQRILIESLVIFTFPLLQVITTYFFLAQRYNVSTLIGCTNNYYRSWQYLLVFHIPTNCFTILTTIWACLTWYRFWKVDKTTRAARNNTSSGMHSRHQRIRRKLFFMCTSILVPFLPMQLFWLYYNISLGLGSLKPYNFAKVHNPSTFNLVTFTTSKGVSPLEVNGNYMAIITVVPIFFWFGFTREAVNTYRVYCLNVGLGKYFPKLHEEYEPDRTRTTNALRSWGQNISSFLKGPSRGSRGGGTGGSSNGSRKNSVLPSFQHVSITSTTASSTSSRHAEDMDTIDEHVTVVVPSKTDSNPWPDVVAAPAPDPAPVRSHLDSPSGTADGAAAADAAVLRIRDHHATRNPFIFRTALSNPLHLLTHGRGAAAAARPEMRLSDFSGVASSSSPSHADARHQYSSGSDTNSLVGGGRDGDGEPWTAVASGGQVGGGKGNRGGSKAAAKVQTRVWSDDAERAAEEGRHRGGDGRYAGGSEIGVALAGGGSGVRVETSIARSERRM